MLTTQQQTKFQAAYKLFRTKYLTKKNEELDESATRIMINSFLSDVLGYTPFDEIKTEYRIRNSYADYVVILNKKQQFVVEVKAIQFDINEKHIKQAGHYAVDEGINWVLLTNGRQFILYRVDLKKSAQYTEVFKHDIRDIKAFKDSFKEIELLHKRNISKGSLEKYWRKCQATNPARLCKHLYSPEVIRFLKRTLKKETNHSFSEEEIFDSVHEIIITAIEHSKPRFKKPSSAALEQ